MRGSGTATFTDPDEYLASVVGASIKLVFGGGGEFKAHLTWVKLPHLHLLRSGENLPRIAYVSLAPGPVFVSFPTQLDPPPILGGVELRSGDIVLHGRGEHSHQRTSGASRWGFISAAPEFLAGHVQALAKLKFVPPHVGRILRPPPSAAACLLRLHARACRLAETKPEIIFHQEVARALEQELLHALVNCLIAPNAREHAAATKNHANIMARFEEVLATHDDRPPRIRELCAAIGVPRRTLQVSCAELLGIGPGRYIRLQRLNMVRAALRHADPATASVGKVANRYGFTELGRFAAAYRTVFGEAPSATFRRADFSASAETA